MSITSKKCIGCLNIKEISNFHKHCATRDGFKGRCIACRRTQARKYAKDNKEAIAAFQKEYRKKNIKKLAKCKKQYYADNKKILIAKTTAYQKTRMKTDPFFKFSRNLRNLIKEAFRRQGYSKGSKTYEILGVDFKSAQAHLEATWLRNYGTPYDGEKVHIDHIIPISSAKDYEELIILNHYSNLQYLTPEDNLKKSNNYRHEPESSLQDAISTNSYSSSTASLGYIPNISTTF